MTAAEVDPAWLAAQSEKMPPLAPDTADRLSRLLFGGDHA